jgi:gamma-glutamyltranspeptidase
MSQGQAVNQIRNSIVRSFPNGPNSVYGLDSLESLKTLLIQKEEVSQMASIDSSGLTISVTTFMNRHVGTHLLLAKSGIIFNNYRQHQHSHTVCKLFIPECFPAFVHMLSKVNFP